MNEILKFWLVLGAIVAGVFGAVGGSMLALSPFMGPKAVGFLWCGVMIATIIAFFSWVIWDDQQGERKLRVNRSLYIIKWYSARL